MINSSIKKLAFQHKSKLTINIILLRKTITRSKFFGKKILTYKKNLLQMSQVKFTNSERIFSIICIQTAKKKKK